MSSKYVTTTGSPVEEIVFQHETGKALYHDGARWVEARRIERPPKPKDANEAADRGSTDNAKESQATQLVKIAINLYDFAATPAGDPFAVPKSGPYVARMLRGGRDSLRGELAHIYVQEHDRAPSSQACADALLVLEGRAMGATLEPHLRTARHENSLVLDLGGSEGRAVVVTADGWQIVDQSPVLFRRTELTAPLPEPEAGGDLVAQIGELVNVGHDHAALLGAWLVAALVPDIGHPIMAFTGEGGTGKSTAAAALTAVLDASQAQLRKSPKDPEAWITAAAGSWCVALDNVSRIAEWFSDSLCRAVTGEGDVRRRLYSDGALSVFSFRRCLVLTGIDLGSLRGDLGRRLILVDLERIDEGATREDDAAAALFARQHPQLLGGVLDLAAKVLKALPHVRPDKLPSMASFARILAAFDEVTGERTFTTYRGMSGTIAEDVVDGDLVASAVRSYVAEVKSWEGSASELLKALTTKLDNPEHPPREWPKNPRALAAALKRSAPALRRVGTSVEHGERTSKAGLWKLGTTTGDGPDSTATTDTTAISAGQASVGSGPSPDTLPTLPTPTYTEPPPKSAGHVGSGGCVGTKPPISLSGDADPPPADDSDPADRMVQRLKGDKRP